MNTIFGGSEVDFLSELKHLHDVESNESTAFSLFILLYSPSEAVDMGSMRRTEAYHPKERASARPVMMQFAYDHTVKRWRVTFRPRGDSVPCPA
jgi:hypothetical protein